MKNDKAINIKIKEILINIIVLIGIVLFYGYYHQKVCISSDTTTTLPMSIDFVHGNIWLKDWVLGTNNFYFTEIVIYAIGILLHFSYATLLNFVPGIAWAVILIGAYYFLDINKKKISAKVIYIALSSSILLVLPYSASYTLLNANSHNNLYAFLIVYLLLLKSYLQGNKPILSYVLMTILGAIMQFSEGVTTMVLVAPLFLFWLFTLILTKKKNILLLCSIVLTYFGGKLIFLIFNLMGGMETQGLPVHFCGINNILPRIRQWIDQFGVLVGCGTIIGGEISFNKSAAIILILLFLFILVYDGIRLKKLSNGCQIFYFITFVNFFACIFTDCAVFYRYIVPAYFFGLALVFAWLADLLEKINKRGLIITELVIALAFSILKCYTKSRQRG